MSKIKELREKRASVVEKMHELSNRAQKENRQMTDDEIRQFDAHEAEERAIKAEYEDLERKAKAEALAEENRQKLEEDQKRAKKEKKDDPKLQYRAAFEKWVRSGMKDLTPEERSIIQERALTTGTGSSGGFTIPEGFANTIESYMALWGGMREVANVLTTATGNPFPYPTENDTSNTGAYLAENSQITEQDVTFAQVNYNAWTATSKLVRVPWALLNDSFLNIENFLSEKFARRVGTLSNNAFTVGDGSSKPAGFVPNAAVGETAAATTAITYDELVNLLHSVDPVYRRNGRWMFNDATFAVIKKLKDGDNRPLWQPSIALDTPDTLLGKPITINQDMADLAASSKSLAFGDFSKYVIRVVQQRGMVRLQERYADYLQDGFFYWERHDGKLINTSAIKVMAQAAS